MFVFANTERVLAKNNTNASASYALIVHKTKYFRDFRSQEKIWIYIFELNSLNQYEVIAYCKKNLERNFFWLIFISFIKILFKFFGIFFVFFSSPFYQFCCVIQCE